MHHVNNVAVHIFCRFCLLFSLVNSGVKGKVVPVLN